MSEDEKREERIKMAEFRIKIYGSITNSSRWRILRTGKTSSGETAKPTILLDRFI